jgi:CheY-like chemotaxis protein
MMPGMDGWEVLAKIKNSVDLRSIPIAMLTVKALDADTLKRKDIQGLVDYILKPFTKESLLSRVEGILDSISKSDHVKRRMLEVDAELAEEYERLERAERLHQNLVLTLKDVLKVHSYSPETLKIRNLIKAEAGLVDLYKGRKREILELILERQKANIRD